MFNKLICCILCVSFMFVSNLKVHANEDSQEFKISDFNELEKKINEHIDIIDNHYVYNVEYVSSLIDDFDVSTLNTKTNIAWTNTSLKNMILSNLNNTIVEENQLTRGTYCNRNYATGGWNYTRLYTSKTQTESWVERFTDESIADATAGIIMSAWATLPGGAILGIPAFLGGVSSLWKSMFARDLNSNNTKNGNSCGVVSDVNSFTGFYTITPQLNWYE